MLSPITFVEQLEGNGVEFFAGVPDSLLQAFCAHIAEHALDGRHIIAANEGAAVALGVGYHLATGKIPLVYLQNSGLGNIINPLLSIVDRDVYSTPLLLLIGWRGEPNVHDEPQHLKQGRVMLSMLDAMEVPHQILTAEAHAAGEIVRRSVADAKKLGGPAAIVVRKGTFEPYQPLPVDNPYKMTREEVVQLVIDTLESSDVLVSTTGMTSREVFESADRRVAK